MKTLEDHQREVKNALAELDEYAKRYYNTAVELAVSNFHGAHATAKEVCDFITIIVDSQINNNLTDIHNKIETYTAAIGSEHGLV